MGPLRSPSSSQREPAAELLFVSGGEKEREKGQREREEKETRKKKFSFSLSPRTRKARSLSLSLSLSPNGRYATKWNASSSLAAFLSSRSSDEGGANELCASRTGSLFFF